MSPADFGGILTRGGTHPQARAARRSSVWIFRRPMASEGTAMVHTYHKLQLDCLLFMLGGNGSTKTATACAKRPQRYRPAQDHR